MQSAPAAAELDSRRRNSGSANSMALIGVLAAATLFRWFNLGRQSLYLDESATWWISTRGTWVATALAEPNRGPLWYLVTRAFVHWLGDSEFVLRLPAAALGVLSVWLVWKLARALLDPLHVPLAAGFRGVDPGAPLAVALLAAMHPFWIEYSQEARTYCALLAGSLGLSVAGVKSRINRALRQLRRSVDREVLI